MLLLRVCALLAATVFLGTAAQAASPISLVPAGSMTAAPVVPSGLKCGVVDGKLVCGQTKGGKKDKDDEKHKDGDHKKEKKKGKKDSGLTECTIQGPNSGGGCKGGFKRVCEKLKSGKKCCGCVPDETAKAPEEKLEDHPCFNHCAGTCGGPTKEARDACILDCLQTTSCRKN